MRLPPLMLLPLGLLVGCGARQARMEPRPAQFYEGEAPGLTFLVWETGEATCGEMGLQLVALGMSRAKARNEIVKVARSLEPAGSWASEIRPTPSVA